MNRMRRPTENTGRHFGQRAERTYVTAALLLCGVIGCTDTVPFLVVEDVIDGNRDPSVTSTLGKTSGEPNGAFSQPVVAVFDGGGVARLQGTVDSFGSSLDLDVFLIGRLNVGDRVIVDADTPRSQLDVSIALFDTEQRLVAENDDRSSFPDLDLDSYIDWIARHDGNSYYLVVTASAFAATGGFSGTYAIDVQVTPGSIVPGPAEQILLLDFDGGEITAPDGTLSVVEPFDVERISPVYAGQSETIKEGIRSTMEQNFQRFNVTIVTTDDPPLSGNVTVSTILFGGFSDSAFGIAPQGIDLYNVDFCDDAVVFTESFAPNGLFTFVPTARKMAIAIANIATHEAGHLLGLNHTSDDLDIMDDQSAADAFLEDQEFIEAPLSPDIMPIGTQDGALLLSEIVGLRDGFALRPLTIVLAPQHAKIRGVHKGTTVGVHSGTQRRLKALRAGS